MDKGMDVRQVVNQLKDRAKELNRAAEVLESESSALLKAINTGGGVELPGVIDVSAVKGFMKSKAFRTVELAKHFNVARENIEKIISSDKDFETSGPGWVRVKSQQREPVGTPVSSPIA